MSFRSRLVFAGKFTDFFHNRTKASYYNVVSFKPVSCGNDPKGDVFRAVVTTSVLDVLARNSTISTLSPNRFDEEGHARLFSIAHNSEWLPD